MSIETELKKIHEALTQISKKLDDLLIEKELISIMKLSEETLQFLNEEPDIYTLDDIKEEYE